MIIYFLSGYLILSMVFLAIGSLSDSMQDAQSYLMPVLLGVMLPVFIMMQASLTDSDSLLTQIPSWVPLYTPFAMLARLATGVSLVEVAGTSVLLVGFIALEQPDIIDLLYVHPAVTRQGVATMLVDAVEPGQLVDRLDAQT